jgi:hypothetical protein
MTPIVLGAAAAGIVLLLFLGLMIKRAMSKETLTLVAERRETPARAQPADSESDWIYGPRAPGNSRARTSPRAAPRTLEPEANRKPAHAAEAPEALTNELEIVTLEGTTAEATAFALKEKAERHAEKVLGEAELGAKESLAQAEQEPIRQPATAHEQIISEANDAGRSTPLG